MGKYFLVIPKTTTQTPPPGKISVHGPPPRVTPRFVIRDDRFSRQRPGVSNARRRLGRRLARVGRSRCPQWGASRGRALSLSSAWNRARSAAATTTVMARTTRAIAEKTAHGRSCDHLLYRARSPVAARRSSSTTRVFSSSADDPPSSASRGAATPRISAAPAPTARRGDGGEVGRAAEPTMGARGVGARAPRARVCRSTHPAAEATSRRVREISGTINRRRSTATGSQFSSWAAA